MTREHKPESETAPESARKVFARLGGSFASREKLAATLPFSSNDVTAGIILTNLVVLPNLSNVSLANNGTHISFGSRRQVAHARFWLAFW